MPSRFFRKNFSPLSNRCSYRDPSSCRPRSFEIHAPSALDRASKDFLSTQRNLESKGEKILRPVIYASTIQHSATFTASFTRRVSWKPSRAAIGAAYLRQSFRSFSQHLERIQELREDMERSMNETPFTEDGKVLFSGMTSKELLATWLNLHLVSWEPLVVLSDKILSSPLIRNHEAFRRPIFGIIKRTTFSHFCAGECAAETSLVIQRTWELGMKSIVDYSVEHAKDDGSCDRNLQGLLETVRQTQTVPAGLVSFSCVKITAICPIPLLERTSNLLRWQHRHADFKLSWKEDVLPFFAEQSATYHVSSPPDHLNVQEEREFLMAKDRLWKLCQACDAAGLPLLVDAEDTSVQPAIDYLTYAAAINFNKNGRPLVYGTMQAYLKDAFPRLTLTAKEASKRAVGFGVKLVRGAYMSKETALAASMDVPSPIHSCIEDTHRCYDTCAAFMMECAASGEGAVVLATHNFESGRAAVTKAEEIGLGKTSSRLQFAQLKGMADGLSLALVHAGFRVSKYLPFGPVESVIPYLIRRADENKGVLGNTVADRIRVRGELCRRLCAF